MIIQIKLPILPSALTQFATHSLNIASPNHPRAVSIQDSSQNVVPGFHAIILNQKQTATRRRDKTLRNGVLSTYRWTFFPFTSSDLVYPGNPPSNRLYLQAYIRINVPEDLRIKVRQQRAHVAVQDTSIRDSLQPDIPVRQT